MTNLTVLRNAFVALSLSQRGQEVQDNFKSLAQLLLGNTTILFQVNGKELEIRITEIEYASSAFEDKINCHELQHEVGRFYIHRHPLSLDAFAAVPRAGFDITCGSSEYFGTLLVRGIAVNGEVIPTLGRSFKAIVENLGLARESYHVIDGQDLFSEDGKIRFVMKDESLQGDVDLDVRQTIVDKSGALLRALWNSGKARPMAVASSKPIAKTVLKSDNQLAATRYNSLMKRSFERDLEAYLYGILFLSKTAADQQDFLDFSFSQEPSQVERRNQIHSSMDDEYTSHEMLRRKNKVFEEFFETHPDIRKKFSNGYSEKFDHRLTKSDFISFFNSSSHCFYCDVSLDELKQLSSKNQIKTKRRYMKGKSLEIDKKDPNGLYELSNIVLCCYWCNNAKTDEYSAEEFVELAKGIRAIWLKRLG